MNKTSTLFIISLILISTVSASKLRTEKGSLTDNYAPTGVSAV